MDLRGTWIGACFAGRDFRDGTVSGEFIDCDFSDTDLRGAHLSGRFIGVNLEGAQLDGATYAAETVIDTEHKTNHRKR
ncbi:MAG: pentapeptide repeat-containing protein [Spirulinaceae cyanobacterium RM2_2_10]|nr:pentapeptide repeat-containing protein [Spirulinaceae cyanobacterium RM2_2_10]